MIPSNSRLLNCALPTSAIRRLSALISRRALMVLIPLSSLGASASAQTAAPVDFNRDVRPILSEYCYHCHGADEGSRKAKLRMDVRTEALKERKGVRAIVPGDLAASEMIVRLTTKDPEEIMPPPKEHRDLNATQIATLKKWVAEGAPYSPHWAFTKPELPKVPSNPAWSVRNPIDAFIAARLEKEKLAPSPAAAPQALLRRVWLDLTGLPPNAEEAARFAADKSPDAYEKSVDRALASTAYGERWARLWMDLGRYADSTGYGQDSLRLNLWPWRDWTIRAFNDNKPFDQFTLEQLAGDLMPKATQDQIVATAFHRNTMTNTEGGTDDEEYRVAAIKDRVATSGQVWMGLTVGCAQCHSHKFDPISQREYYQMFAIFNQTEDADRGDEAPKIPLPTDHERQQREQLNTEIAALQAKIGGMNAELEAELDEWEANFKTRGAWTVLPVSDARATDNVKFEKQADGSLLATGESPKEATYEITVDGPLKEVNAFRLEALPDPSLPNNGPGRNSSGNAVVSGFAVHQISNQTATRGRYVRIELPGEGRLLHIAEVQVISANQNIAPKGSASQSSTAFDGAAKLAIDGNTEGHYFNGKSVTHTAEGNDPWWELDLGSEQNIDKIVLWNRTDTGAERIIGARISVLDAKRGAVAEHTLDAAPSPSVEFAPAARSAVTLQNANADFSQMGYEAALVLDDKKKSGWAFSPAIGKAHALVLETKAPLNLAAGQQIQIAIQQNNGSRMTLGRFRLSATSQPKPVREVPEDIRAILAKAKAARSGPDKVALAAFFQPSSKVAAALNAQIDAKKTALTKIKPIQLPIMKELAGEKRRKSFLFSKGNFRTPGDPVEPALPSSFHPAPEGEITRLAFAQWIVSPENPLTARVTVNRFWAQLFGTGLVETEEDFGTQGTLPSHPELLDWLSVEFIKPSQTGATPWDIKRLLKLMVTSATYRQDSKTSPELLQKDPRNRLLAHAPHRRLEAEAVRDQALQIAGLLSPKIGGPSVYPPQPDGLWKVAFNKGENAYPTSTGEDRWRRSLYTVWRRSAPNPTLTTFDAPSRETCTLRRQPTNTPLQAFVTLNDPVFVECSQALARRIVQQGGSDTESRIRFGLALCLGQAGSDDQVKTIKELFEAELLACQAAPADAAKLAASAALPLPPAANAVELAAWTTVANVLLNLDAVLTNH